MLLTLPRPLEYPADLLRSSVPGFLVAAEPIVRRALGDLHRKIDATLGPERTGRWDPASLDRILLGLLGDRLLSTLTGTLLLELHVARLREQLPGDTPEERFVSFLDRLRAPDVQAALFGEYPLLHEQLALVIEQWTTFSLEFLQRLCSDWSAIRSTLAPEGDPGPLVALDGGIGDRHRGGRSVLVARFASGFQVVYKPRSLAVDVHLGELIAWLERRGADPTLRTPLVIDRQGHGWTEYVAAEPCRTEQQVQRFYRRQGASLALLYLLDATDFHWENLIAAGEHPVLIDLESLFHPRIQHHQPLDGGAMGSLAGTSVLRVGLLPQRFWPDEDQPGIDLSGLGGVAGQLTPRPVPWLAGAGTDQARIEPKRVAMKGAVNQPVLDGGIVQPTAHTGAIVSGFVALYRLLLEHRAELLAAGGPLDRFADDETRAILRGTHTYQTLLSASRHPDLMRDPAEREGLFDRLATATEQRPDLQRAIPAERADLMRGDIPFFTARPGSRDLQTSTGQVIPDFFAESALSSVRRRLEAFGEGDLNRQRWVIETALAIAADQAGLTVPADRSPFAFRAASDGHDGRDPRRDPGGELIDARTRERLLATAQAIGDRLESLALVQDGEAAWMGLYLMDGNRWTIRVCGLDLYDGLSGIALFLAHLGAITAEERYTRLARMALATVRRLLPQPAPVFESVGAFSGWGGLIYSLTHLGTLWHEPALLDEATALVATLPPLIERDEITDVIGGSAGCLLVLLGLHATTGSARALETAVACGERLLATARPLEDGEIVWRHPKLNALTGCGHGAAGYSWALARLAAATGREAFLAAARAALTYERRLFSAEAQNWPDLRPSDPLGLQRETGQSRFMSGWCHGAPGIGLARLASAADLDDPAIAGEIDSAVQNTLARGFGGSHSLCHGDLGNLELLLAVLRRPGQGHAPQQLDQLRAQVRAITAATIERIEQSGWRCGVPMRAETPGLMVGLAGIGHGLLRLAAPDQVPSVLTLDPPAR